MPDDLTSAVHSLCTNPISDPLTEQESRLIYDTLTNSEPNVPTCSSCRRKMGFSLVGDAIARELETKLRAVYNEDTEVFKTSRVEPHEVRFPETANMVSYITADITIEHLPVLDFVSGNHSLILRNDKAILPEYSLGGVIKLADKVMEIGATHAVEDIHKSVWQLSANLVGLESKINAALTVPLARTVHVVGIRNSVSSVTTDGYGQGEANRGWWFGTIRSNVVYSWV